jgi:hypothetical protein
MFAGREIRMTKNMFIVLFICGGLLLPSCRGLEKGPAIFISKEASPLERLAAREVRRYIYLRTGNIVPIKAPAEIPHAQGRAIVVAAKNRFPGSGWGEPELLRRVESLGAQEYLLKSVPSRKAAVLIVVGGDGIGTLYGAYRLAEKLGIRFALHGDVVPDGRIPLEIPGVDERGKPLFRLRGIHPFHDFPEGPDWWDTEHYKAVLGQLPKLRMNFFGLHTYPEGRPNAEPTVWIGLPEESRADGSVSSSYPSSYQNTLRGNWSYEATKTGDFHFGAAGLFESDAYGPEVMHGFMPEPKTPEGSNEVFNRTAAMLRDAFAFARNLGIKTCVGTEMPLTIPALVKERLRQKSLNPDDPAVVKEVYKGIFTRLKNAYPPDYYWLWTDENWTWSDADEKTVQGVVDDALAAIEAAAEVGAPFAIATCGWVLGPPGDRTLFDRALPKTTAVSSINREVGKAPVDPMFARVEGRSKWAIPWLEDDPALTSPQLWAGRMRKDAVDALAYGCDGLMGIHWRTRILSPTIGALAAAAWDQEPWGKSLAPLPDEGPTNGVYVTISGSKIAGTTEEAVYKDIRDRVFGYRLAVPDGTYDVVLKFCEGEIREKGRRVFDVSIQGKKAAEKVDIFDRVGFHRALDMRFRGVVVENGRLDIDFTDRIHYPSIAGLVVTGKNFSKKINCGGGETGDYEADWPETPRHAPVLDFYEDWARAEFGPEAAADAAAVLAGIDGHLPQPNVWTGPGGIKPDPRPWDEVRKEYGFLDDLAALESRVAGPANKARFAYWLSAFSYMREMARLECLWAEFNAALEAVRKLPDESSRKAAASEKLLPIRERMVAGLRDLYGFLLATVSSPGELGTVANWEQHLLPALMLRPIEELGQVLGRELPLPARLSREYDGPPRVIVPTVRTVLSAGETLRLKVIVLAKERPSRATLLWREMGKGEYAGVPLQHMARGVYAAACPDTDKDLEYYVEVMIENELIRFPPTAPLSGQTVVRTR